MTIRSAFDFDPPGPNGEKLVSVADPADSAEGDKSYYMTRLFTFAEGIYQFDVTADDAATVWIGTGDLNTRMVASAVFGVPSQSKAYIAAGNYRVDLILENLAVVPNPCAFTLVISDESGNVVYASSKDDWLLDDAPINDADLPAASDARLRLPVFTLLPNWADGVTERLSFLTDVLSSESDAEQRRSVRRHPRRGFEASFLRQRAQRDRLDAFFVGVGMSQFLLPIWIEQVKMYEGIDIGATGVFFPDGDFQMREFRAGDLVFVNAGDPDDYDILKIGDIEENRFSWAVPPQRSWPRGTRIYPLRVAHLTQNPKIGNVTDTVATAQVLFDLVDPDERPPSWGATQNGEPYFNFKPNRAQVIDTEYKRKSYTLDNQSGPTRVTDTGRYSATISKVNMTLFGRSAVYAFRQFIAAARGRAVHFQSPTFMHDIELTDDILNGTTDLFIKPQGYTAYMARPQPTRLTLAFQFDSGENTLYRYIDACQEVYRLDAFGEVALPLVVVAEVLTLSEALPEIKRDELKRISFAAETRFDQDQFELHHVTNGMRAVTTTVVLRQAQNPRIGIDS